MRASRRRDKTGVNAGFVAFSQHFTRLVLHSDAGFRAANCKYQLSEYHRCLSNVKTSGPELKLPEDLEPDVLFTRQKYGSSSLNSRERETAFKSLLRLGATMPVAKFAARDWVDQRPICFELVVATKL